MKSNRISKTRPRREKRASTIYNTRYAYQKSHYLPLKTVQTINASHSYLNPELPTNVSIPSAHTRRNKNMLERMIVRSAICASERHVKHCNQKIQEKYETHIITSGKVVPKTYHGHIPSRLDIEIREITRTADKYRL